MIQARNKLRQEELSEAKKLINCCQNYDDTYRDPYLSNMLNFDPNMPAFFLYYEKGVMLYHGVTLGGTGKDVGKRHPTVRKGALISAHAQVIGPVEIGENAKVGAAAVVVADVPSDVTVVGIPAKIVRVHGQKDEPTIHEVEVKREYYVNKLEQAKDASHRSSGL